MQRAEILDFLQHMGRDPSRLIFEDELTGVHNRRFLHSYLEHKVHWTSGTDYPLSLLILDIDRFKDINDTHGHATGDQVLTWAAAALRDVAADAGLPVRFGGDEFVVLLPRTDQVGARDLAARLLQRMRHRPFRLPDAGVTLAVTASIGIATAPGDGNSSQALLQAADTALYHAKQSGRNQAAAAAEVDPKKVFPRIALHRLLASGIAGRDVELGAVSEALIALSRGQSQFLILEGASGMGKTTFIETISRNLARNVGGFAVAQIGGDPQEAYRPYYLATRLFVALLNRRDDKGTALLQSLSAEEAAHLSLIVPQVAEGATAAPVADEAATRQRIFSVLGHFVPRLVDGHPLVVIIDDLHLVDEASLLLLRALFQGRKLPLLVCGATLEALSLDREKEATPIERFSSSRARELGIRRLRLGALSATHILDYLRGVFPNLRMPQGFEVELARITQGNPLFLGEIIRKLVADRKVTFVGPEWVIAEIEASYLPQSLEAIVQEKIAALDAEDRHLLERAAALGEDVPVSVLTGSSQLDENQVLRFLDRAEALGLVSLDFQRNDDVMRFLGKRVMEITYGGIEEGRRRALHEQVGAYQEGLNQQQMLSSASLLAYHFKRSANQEKAQRYERVQRTNAQTLFDPEEAARYPAELLEEEPEPEGRLAPDSVALVPNVVRALITTVRSIHLYPPESKAIPQALQLLHQGLVEVLSQNACLQLAQERRVLLANGQRLDVSDWSALAESLLEMLDRLQLQSLTFQRGVTDAELRTMLTALASTKPEGVRPGFWKAFARERELKHIQPQQVRYSSVLRARGAAGRAAGEESRLDAEDLAEIPRILRALQAASKTVKLYPVESEPVTRAVEQFHTSLQGVLFRRQTLTLTCAEHALLGNGVRLDTSAYAGIAGPVVELLDAAGLESVTWFAGVQPSEMAVFLGALRDVPASGADSRFWNALVRDKGLTGLAFNHRKYARGVVDGLLAAGEAGELTEADSAAAAVDRLSEEPMEALRQALPQLGKELLVKGEDALLRRLLRRQFQEFQKQDASSRAKTVQACHALMDRVILGLQHKFADLAAEFVLPALATESEPQVLREFADVLYSMTATSIQFANHQLASRILLDLRGRQRALKETGGREGDRLAALLDRGIGPAALKLLEEDLRSGQADRHERAAQVLGALGAVATPLLIDVIRQENDFRIRNLAARLLAESDPQGPLQVKRALVTEVLFEQRTRMLEVIDVVTRDLRLELEQCLGDNNPRVRRAAFQLFERLGQDDLVPLVAPFARHPDPAVARGAIRALTSLCSPAAVHALAAILETAKDDGLATVLCQALGQSEQATAIDALARVLAERKVFFFGRRWSADVRATAALVLKQIPHPSVAEVLARYENDSDAKVQQIARSPRISRTSGAQFKITADLPPES